MGDDVGRGYLAADFMESWQRYVPKTEREELLSELKWQMAKKEEEQKRLEEEELRRIEEKERVSEQWRARWGTKH